MENDFKILKDLFDYDFSAIEKELGIELVGDVKVKIEANMEEDPWDDIVEDKDVEDIKNVTGILCLGQKGVPIRANKSLK